MIFNTLFGAFLGILASFIGLFNLPGLPESILSGAMSLLDLLFENLTLLGLFIRISTLKVTCALLVIIFNFEHIYRFFRWAFKNIPFNK